MDSMIDLLVLGVSDIHCSQPIASIPPCDPCRSSRWTARMHRILCPPALSPCRAAAPGSNVDTWSSLNRKPTFPTFQVVKVGIFLTKNDCTSSTSKNYLPRWNFACFSYVIYIYICTHKSPHFHNNPLLAINPKGKTTLKEPQRIPPWVLPTLNGIAQKNNVAAQLLQTHLLAGENTETWPVSLNSNGLFLLPCRIFQ